MRSNVLFDVLRGCWESVRETLPTTEQDVAPFVAGLAWGLVIYVLLLILVSWATLTATGAR